MKLLGEHLPRRSLQALLPSDRQKEMEPTSHNCKSSSVSGTYTYHAGSSYSLADYGRDPRSFWQLERAEL